MTISARRAALLGLTVPLSAVMTAVLGLWPEEDDEVVVVPPFSGDPKGGGDGRRRGERKTTPRSDKADEWIAEQRRIARANRLAIAIIVAIAEQEFA